MEKYSKAVSEMYSQFKQRESHPMEKYSKAVREMYSQFKKKESHPMEKYIGRLVRFSGEKVEVEVVGYCADMSSLAKLIIDASQVGGWSVLAPSDVVFKECKYYWYISINDLID